MSNLNNLFIKNPAWSLNDVDYKELTSTKDMNNAYNIFMMSQLFFLWSEKKVFGKKVTKNMAEFLILFGRKKVFRIDQKQKINFL
jgi:hypothetical protein